MEAVGGQARDLGTRRDADRVHHRRAFRADSPQDHTLKVVPVVESVDAGCADTRPVGDHEGVAGNGVTVDDLVSSLGFFEEAGDSADCREMLKDIDRVVHDDDDAGSAEAHDRVAGSAKFTL